MSEEREKTDIPESTLRESIGSIWHYTVGFLKLGVVPR